MGVVIQFGDYHKDETSIEMLRGFAMLQVEPPTHRSFKAIERALLAVLMHPRFPNFVCETSDLLTVDDMLGRKQVLERGTAFTMSLARLRRQSGGWDPMDLPICAAIKRDSEGYLLLRNVLGIVCLIWQVAEYPDSVVTTTEGFNELFSAPPISSPGLRTHT